jgi:hypothetical protein
MRRHDTDRPSDAKDDCDYFCMMRRDENDDRGCRCNIRHDDKDD